MRTVRASACPGRAPLVLTGGAKIQDPGAIRIEVILCLALVCAGSRISFRSGQEALAALVRDTRQEQQAPGVPPLDSGSCSARAKPARAGRDMSVVIQRHINGGRSTELASDNVLAALVAVVLAEIERTGHGRAHPV